SDLASLKTRAVRDGDHYVINGTKIWTTHAHHANRMFALVRTQTGARPQTTALMGIAGESVQDPSGVLKERQREMLL
ncbi:acyl-CoA dehydrogenase family protein, partial [Enterobacter hormaechei]|uniref:acyl-CoA dehydrogenase family protein n=1 Tax=Enterobacter hormaechei TaxID=158836 RepID=UPI0019549D63